MSDAIDIDTPEPVDPEREAVLARAAKAREAMAAKRAAIAAGVEPAPTKRTQRPWHRAATPTRTAEKRTMPPRAAAAPQPEPVRAERGYEDEPVTRVGRNDRMSNRFPVPEKYRKQGRDYQWIVLTVLGEPVSTPPITEFYEGGWRPEKARDWPTVVPPGTAPDAAVDWLGQRLFGRPMAFSIEAKQEDYQAAEQQRRDRMQSAIEGRPTGGEMLAGQRGIKVVPLQADLEGEIGSRVPRR